MAKKQPGKRGRRASKAVLWWPDLDQAKSAVLNSLSSADARRGYRHAIDEFVAWYCSEPRLSFSKGVVLRYRNDLESRRLAPGTINLRLGAVRRLAYEAADSGLLSPDLAAGIRRVRGVKKLGVRLGNWLTPEQSYRLSHAPDVERLMNTGRSSDLNGKAVRMRTIPMPKWVKALLDDWIQAANLTLGKLFRGVSKNGKALGTGLTEKAVRHVVRDYAGKAGIEKLAPHDLRRTCARLCHAAGGELEQIQLLLCHVSIESAS